MKYKTLYAQQCVEIAIKDIVGLPLNEERRGDYKFLLQLVKALKQYRQTNQKPVIKNFPNSAPSISNARWNSRTNYALFAELCDLNYQNLFTLNSSIIDVSPIYNYIYIFNMFILL